MAGYARFRRARKGVGSRRGMRRSGGNRGSRYGYKKTGYRIKPRFATVGFARNVEKKYHDKTYQANTNEVLTGQTAPLLGNNGVTYISNTWGNYSFGAQVPTAAVVSNDMLKGVATGTTARTRIGNKLRVNYVKGAFTFNAGLVSAALSGSQGGEVFVSASGPATNAQFMRTTIRFCIVKDMQVNSTDTQVTWAQVFDTTNLQAGVHSELNVDNMGRFIVLEDKVFTLDADTPQKTYPFVISGSKLGSVRYNGPSDAALTDKGLYVVWAAFVMGYTGGTADVIMTSPVGHSRLCFTDD